MKPTINDDQFIEAFWDRTWRPTPGVHPSYVAFMRKKLGSYKGPYKQPWLAHMSLPFFRAIDEQLYELKRLPGINPLLDLDYRFIAGEFSKSLKPLDSAYRAVNAGVADLKTEGVIKAFIIRCVETWARYGWPWPWEIEKPAPAYERAAEEMARVVDALKEAIGRGEVKLRVS